MIYDKVDYFKSYRANPVNHWHSDYQKIVNRYFIVCVALMIVLQAIWNYSAADLVIFVSWLIVLTIASWMSVFLLFACVFWLSIVWKWMNVK